MPKKSKKQKMRAFAHFQTKMQGVPVVVKTEEKITEHPISQEEMVTAHNFKIDLKKSLLLISGIIALEIIFYFASMSTVWFRLFKY